MQIPKPTWFLFNLFRITAVVFLIWALVAQFVALANDIKEQSEARRNVVVPASQATTTNQTSSRTSSSSSLLVASSSRPTASPTIIRTFTTTTTPQSQTRLTRVIEAEDSSTTRSATLLTTTRLTTSAETDALVVPVRREFARRAEAEPTSGTHGLSSIPTSNGGVLFAAVSRMLMVLALGFLILAQLGIPEMWLYRHTPIFGPQSTPLWLGIAQVVVAVENLRVYSVAVVWSAHAGLLVIGMINAHLALLLIFLARRRKLPKQPPPPLYFSHVTRLLFFRPPPACYLPLLDKLDGNESVKMKPAPGRSRGLQVSIGDPEIGINDNAHTDVRQGGYPTFARGGLGHPGSQIPAATIDATQGGHVRGFIARPPADAVDTRSVETGDAYSGVADDESRGSSLAARNASISSLGSSRSNRGKRKPAPLGLEQSNSMPDRQKEERQRNIEALREKLSGRLERNASAAGSSSAAPKISHPVLQRSASDQAAAPGIAHVGRGGDPQNSASSTTTTRLPTIPKRSNTLDQPSARTPHLGSARTTAEVTVPKLSASAEKPPTPPAKMTKPPKSPAKSIAGSLYSSILPWTKASRPSSPDKTEGVASTRQQQPPLPPVKWPTKTVQPSNNETADKRQAEDAHQKPRPQRVDQLAGTSRSASPSPDGALVRSDSGSNLLKKLKGHRGPSPTPLSTDNNKPLTRSDTLPTPRGKPTSYGDVPARQASLGAKGHSGSPSTSTDDSVKDKAGAADKRGSPMAPKSPTPSPPDSPPVRPVTTQSMYPNPALRSSIATLARSGSTRSARSARTAMGVRFDLEKRHSSSSESLLSPDAHDTPTPRSAGFRIPGTKLTIPFPSTPRNRASTGSTPASTPSTGYHPDASDLILEMKDSDDDLTSLEAARPESLASLSSAGSTYQRKGLGHLTAETGDDEKPSPLVKSIGERAGLPKRANTVINDPGKQARRSHHVILGGGFLDGGDVLDNKRGHRRRPSSVSIDASGRINV